MPCCSYVAANVDKFLAVTGAYDGGDNEDNKSDATSHVRTTAPVHVLPNEQVGTFPPYFFTASIAF